MVKIKTSQSWHTDCELEYRYTDREGVRGYWCPTHHQWDYIFPATVVYRYAPELGLPDHEVPKR